MSSGGIQLTNYLMLYKHESSIHKRNKKKMAKRNLLKALDVEMMKYHDENSLLQCLLNYLISAKRKKVNNCGIIIDTNIILHDITYIPLFPKRYDILCLESEIKAYKNDTKDDGKKNVYWTPTEILSSGNFIINGASIDKIIEYLKQINTTNTNTLKKLFEMTNSLDVFTITQHQFSERETNYVHDPVVYNKKLTTEQKIQYDGKVFNEFYNKFKTMNIQVDNLKRYNISDNLLPKISLICPFTNKNNFFHCLLSFLRLDYPRSLLEFIIVDDTNSEKHLNLPNDSRIKLVNIKNTGNNNNNLTLGFKLNTGVKQASNDLIMHFFDTSNYTLNLKELVTHFILSQKECVVSKDTGIHLKQYSFKVNSPDLSNCIYTKNFWAKYPFEQYSHNFYINSDLIHKWTTSRLNEISFLPFIYFSFKLQPTEQTHTLESYMETYMETLPINLSNLVDKKIKESFGLLY